MLKHPRSLKSGTVVFAVAAFGAAAIGIQSDTPLLGASSSVQSPETNAQEPSASARVPEDPPGSVAPPNDVDMFFDPFTMPRNLPAPIQPTPPKGSFVEVFRRGQRAEERKLLLSHYHAQQDIHDFSPLEGLRAPLLGSRSLSATDGILPVVQPLLLAQPKEGTYAKKFVDTLERQVFGSRYHSEYSPPKSPEVINFSREKFDADGKATAQQKEEWFENAKAIYYYRLPNGKTLLHLAAQSGDVEAVKVVAFAAFKAQYTDADDLKDIQTYFATKDYSGKTASQYAAAKTNIQTFLDCVRKVNNDNEDELAMFVSCYILFDNSENFKIPVD
eukprot:gene1323-369_t